MRRREAAVVLDALLCKGSLEGLLCEEAELDGTAQSGRRGDFDLDAR